MITDDPGPPFAKKWPRAGRQRGEVQECDSESTLSLATTRNQVLPEARPRELR
jgi:hypothetical protein